LLQGLFTQTIQALSFRNHEHILIYNALKAKGITERRIAVLLGITRTGQRYQARPKPQDHRAELIKTLSAD